MPRLFALDKNFPQPIVGVLSDFQADAQLVPLDQIDSRMSTLDDWELLLALHHHTAPWDGLITTDSSMLAQGPELAALIQTRKPNKLLKTRVRQVDPALTRDSLAQPVVVGRRDGTADVACATSDASKASRAWSLLIHASTTADRSSQDARRAISAISAARACRCRCLAAALPPVSELTCAAGVAYRLASLSDIDADDAADLRAALVRAAQNTDLAERTLEVVAVVEAAGAPMGIHPVVVGGMAVYFWTASEEFVTYDIDVVMAVPDELAAKLGELGFIRASDGRHWTLEDTEIFLEAPSVHLDSDAVVAEVKLQSGRTAKVLSRVDVLIDRLAEFQSTGHETAAQQALALLAGLSEDEADDLDARVATHHVSTILNAVRKLADDLEAGSAPPDSDELHQIARAALRAEYPPKQL